MCVMQGTGDVYESRPVKKSNTSGGVHSDVAALTAISATSQVPQTIDCELCRATFNSETLYRQHISSTVHRKAVEKLDAEIARRQRMSAYNDVAEAALGAAAWNNTHGTGGGRSGGSGRRPHMGGSASSETSAGNRQQQQKIHPPKDDHDQKVKPRDVMSHAEIVAQMSSQSGEESGPVTIDGWAPPSIAATSAPLVTPSKGRGEDEEEEEAKDREGGKDGRGQQDIASLESARCRQVASSKAKEDDSEGSRGGDLLGLGLDYSDSADSAESDKSDSESDGQPISSFF